MDHEVAGYDPAEYDDDEIPDEVQDWNDALDDAFHEFADGQDRANEDGWFYEDD